MEPLLDSEMNEAQTDYDQASNGQRFGNYLIDVIAYYILSLVAGVVLGIVAPGVAEDEASLNIASILIAIVILLGYYTLMEGSGGKTLGKYITGTRAVTENGEPLTMGQAFTRSLCRLIPFEPFSFLFGRGWHDSLSKTMVIRDRRR